MKMYVFCVLFALVLLAGCAQHIGPLTPHTPAPARAKAAARVPLTLSLDGVRFDQMTRPQAVDALEQQGFEPVRVAPHYDCDIFRAPATLPGASRLSACWVRRNGASLWAEAWLTFPPVLHGRVRTLRFGALLHVLARRFGTRGSFWLHQPGALRATWRPDSGRGLVRLTQGFPRPVMHLKIADARELRALLASVRRQDAARRNADDPLVSHPTPAPTSRAPVPVAPTAPAAVTPPRPGAGFPVPAAFYPQAAQRLGEEGTASLRICVNRLGQVTSASVARSSGSHMLDQAALRFARATSGHWRAAELGGRAAAGCTTLPVRFSVLGGL